jgi:uncharacterized protein
MIIEKTYNLLLRKYKHRFENLIISDIRIGLHLTVVSLSDGSTGTSATLIENDHFRAKSRRDFGEFTPLNIRGRKVLDLLETKKESGLILSLKGAVLNAISSGIISSGEYRIIENCDPVQLVDINADKTVTIVGAFQSYIRKISESKNRLFVLEMNENALDDEQSKFFVPANEYRRVLPDSDIVIITGQTLVNRTIDDLLDAISPGTQVIVTGPSGSIIPDILFENKVSIVGSMRITHPEILFDIVGEGGTGYHLFEYYAEKICILKGDESKT